MKREWEDVVILYADGRTDALFVPRGIPFIWIAERRDPLPAPYRPRCFQRVPGEGVTPTYVERRDATS